MKILYRLNIDGKAQLQNDETGIGLAIKNAAPRLGYVITKFAMIVSGEVIEVMALTPDTMIAAERLRLEQSILFHYPRLKQIKRIKL